MYPLVFVHLRGTDSIPQVNSSIFLLWVSFFIICFIYIFNRLSILFCTISFFQNLEEFIIVQGIRFISWTCLKTRWSITIAEYDVIIAKICLSSLVLAILFSSRLICLNQTLLGSRSLNLLSLIQTNQLTTNTSRQRWLQALTKSFLQGFSHLSHLLSSNFVYEFLLCHPHFIIKYHWL